MAHRFGDTSAGPPTTVSPAGIVGAAGLGTPSATPGPLTLNAIGIRGQAALGTAVVAAGPPFELPFPDAVTAPDLHAGDVGVFLESTVMDPQGSPMDLTGAALSFVFQKPDGSTLAVDASAGSAAGVVRYPFAAGDLDQPGTWLYQALVAAATFSIHTDVGRLRVKPNLPI